MMTAQEIESALEVLRADGRISSDSTFHGCCIHEPPKKELAGWKEGDHLDRRLELVVRHENEVYEALVSVTRNEVDEWRLVPGVIPRVGFVELFRVMEACRNDDGFREALRKRGIDEPSNVQIDPWPTGDYGFSFEAVSYTHLTLPTKA